MDEPKENMTMIRNQATMAAILAGVAVLGSYALACAAPFAALAAVAALGLPLGHAVATMIAAWLANQAIGFLVLSYPWDAQGALWGVAIGIGSVACVLAAKAVLDLAGSNAWLRPILAFGTAFVVFEIALLAWVPLLGDAAMFAPAIVAEVLGYNVAFVAVLLVLQTIASRSVRLGEIASAR
jgi:hypothetical protein